jgi:hypothetical protein
MTRRRAMPALARASASSSSGSGHWTALAGLSAKGIAAEPPGLPGGADGPRTSRITDPDGYRIELVQWPARHADGITKADFACGAGTRPRDACQGRRDRPASATITPDCSSAEAQVPISPIPCASAQLSIPSSTRTDYPFRRRFSHSVAVCRLTAVELLLTWVPLSGVALKCNYGSPSSRRPRI